MSVGAAAERKQEREIALWIGGAVAAVVAWVVIYRQLAPFSAWAGGNCQSTRRVNSGSRSRSLSTTRRKC